MSGLTPEMIGKAQKAAWDDCNPRPCDHEQLASLDVDEQTYGRPRLYFCNACGVEVRGNVEIMESRCDS